MTPEQIRAEAIERLAFMQFELDEPGGEKFEDWAPQYRREVAKYVDALGDLLPIGADYRWVYKPDGTPLGYRERQLLTPWSEAPAPCPGCRSTERECGRQRGGAKCCTSCRHPLREVPE